MPLVVGTCLIMTGPCCAYIFAIAEALFISLPLEPLNVTPKSSVLSLSNSAFVTVLCPLQLLHVHFVT